MSNLIVDAIRDYLGERCPDFETGCLCCRAWAEYDDITRLRSENERLTRQFAEHADRTADDIAALRADNERLRAALRPFAEAADGFDMTRIKNPEEWFAYRGIVSSTESKGAITVGDLRRARAALEVK